MRVRLLQLFISAGYFLSFSVHAENAYSVFQYEKSLHSEGHLDIVGIFSDNFSEIRWDKNGDGHIDQWLIRDSSLEVAELFQDGKLQSFTIRKRELNYDLVISYVVDSKGQLNLAQSRAIPFQRFFNDDDDLLGPSVISGAKSAKNTSNMCRPVSGSINLEKLKELREIASRGELDGKIKKMINPQCSSQLSSAQKDSLQSALKTVFELNLEGPIEQNKIVSCMAQNKFTQNLVPLYIDTLVSAPLGDESKGIPPLQIRCTPNPAGQCGPSYFEEKSCQIHLPIPNPPCQSDLRDFYLTNLLHETLHRVSSEVPEQAVQDVVRTCLNKTGASTGVRKDYQAGLGIQNVILTPGPASTTNSSNKVAGEKTAIVPQELAAGKVSPGAPGGGTASFASLDSGFRPLSSGNSNMTTQVAYQQSRARTSPVLSLAEGIVKNAILQSAQAETVGSASTTRPSTPSAEAVRNASSSPSSFSKSNKSAWLEDSKQAASISASVNSPDLGAASQGARVSSLNGEKSEARDVAASKPSKSFSDSPARAPSSSSGSSRVPLATSNKTNSVPREKNNQDPQNRRTEIESRLRQLSSGPLWEFVARNQAEIEKYKIHILDSKNKVWGFKDPSRASVQLREQNSRLIREDR